MRSVAVACATCMTISGTASAQPSVPAGLETGTTGIGSQVSVFFVGNSVFRSGIEIGYSKVGRVEQETMIGGDPMSTSAFQTRTTSKRLWHASLVARRQWPTLNRQARIYAVGGTGVYMGRTSTQEIRHDALAGDLMTGFTTSHRNWAVGANLGGGIEFQRSGWPGAVGLDARLHLLPFAGASETRALLTFSAGLSFF